MAEGQGQIKSGRAKVEQSVGKKQGRALCNINKQLCRALGQGQNARQVKMGQNIVSRSGQLLKVASSENNYSQIYNSSKLASN